MREFITTMECVFEENEEGEEVEVGVEALVKGTRVKITIDGFNEHFGCEEDRPEDLSEVDEVEEMRRHKKGYGKTIEEALFEPGYNMRSPNAYDHLSTKAKVVNKVLYNRVYSRLSPRKIVKERLALVYGILNPKMMINLGFHVVQSLMEMCAAKKKIESLPYPRLITMFCLKAKVKGSSVVTSWAFSRNQLLRTKGFDAPKGRRPRVRRSQEPREGDGNDGAESSVASTQRESMVRMEAYFERQDAMFSRMDAFMESQARFMEQVGEALKIGRATDGSDEQYH